MKYEFWFDLPQALGNIIEENLTEEERKYTDLLIKSSESFNKIFVEFTFRLEENHTSMQREELEEIKDKLNSIQKDRVALLCKSIKLSTKLMMKIISAFEAYETLNLPINELLVKIKLFSKITRLVLENSKVPAAVKGGKESEFFSMIQAFTEKIQSKLYGISNLLIQSYLSKQAVTETKREWIPESPRIKKGATENVQTC